MVNVITCSGYGIAARALSSVIRAHDGRGSQTMLTSRILKALGLSSPDEIIGYVCVKIKGSRSHFTTGLGFRGPWQLEIEILQLVSMSKIIGERQRLAEQY